jgi:hypothetical protein
VADEAAPEEQGETGGEYTDEHAEERAYKAGYALPSVNWTPVLDVTTPEQRTPGVHHCPFAEGDPLRAHWMNGLRARLSEQEPYDPAAIIEHIEDEIG